MPKIKVQRTEKNDKAIVKYLSGFPKEMQTPPSQMSDSLYAEMLGNIEDAYMYNVDLDI
jgi:hypothetical protein